MSKSIVCRLGPWGIVLGWAVLAGMGTAAEPARRDPPVPSSNADLEAILETAQAYEALECICPEMDCSRAREVLQGMADLVGHLEAMVRSLEDANADAMAHFKSVAAEGMQSNEQLGRTILALGVQEYLHDLGSLLLDIASVSSFFEEVLEDPSKLASKSPAQILENVDKFYEAVKDHESGVTTIAGSLAGQEIDGPVGDLTPDVLGFEGGELNDHKSTLSDVASILKDVHEKGGDVREALKKPNGPGAALGQIAGRYLKAYSSGQMQERKEAIAELERSLAASDLTQAQSFRELQKVQNRRFAAEDALAAVRAALQSFGACAAKACGQMSLTRPQIPSFERTYQGRVHKSWGEALQYFNDAIPKLHARLEPMPEIEERVPCTPVDSDTTGVGFLPSPVGVIGFDTPVWCNFGGGSTPVPVPGEPGTTPPGGPVTTPPEGGPTLPGGVPTTPGGTPTTPGGTPEIPGGPPTAPPGPGTTEHPPTTPPTTPEEPTDGPPTAPPVVVKATRTAIAAGAQAQAVQGALLKLEIPSPALPIAGNTPTDVGFDESPAQAVTGADGTARLDSPAGGDAAPAEVSVDLTPQSSKMVTLGGDDPSAALHPDLHPYWVRSFLLDGMVVAVLFYPEEAEATIGRLISESPNVVHSETNYCREKEEGPNDPYLASSGSWGQAYADQWSLHRVGFTPGADSAWNVPGGRNAPVIVAVIDSGLDWNHKDLSWDNIWRNPGEIPDNGRDDDGNGYVDDAIGWDFFSGTNKPWDYDGHGTFVTGLIAARRDNGVGIAGIDPNAKIMVLKALNSFGHTRASFIAEAVLYAANHGARVINLSVGGKKTTRAEQKAIAYAVSKGVVVVVAAGNEGVDVEDFGPASFDTVVTVAATDATDRRAPFSNWGRGIDLAAPGVDILSLRARRTDLMRDLPGTEYTPGSAFVGTDHRYYRTSGTSFAAPIVAGTASLLFSRNPDLTAEQVVRMLLHSAKDIETPGRDQLTGYGLLDARAALVADPDFFLTAEITGVAATQRDGATVVEVNGTLDGSSLARGWLEIGAGEAPTAWKKVGSELRQGVEAGVLGAIPASEFAGSKVWTIRAVGEDASGKRREAWFRLNLG